MKNWSNIGNPENSLANFISKQIFSLEDDEKIHFPNLRDSDTLYIFSDYSHNKIQQVISYTFLVLDNESFELFCLTQKEFWEENFLDDRIIDYKGLNDNIKLRALTPFLKFSNILNGGIFTFILDKDIKTLFEDFISEDFKEELSIWGNKIQEKILRLREIVILLLNGLAAPNQNIFWITDNDDFVANHSQLERANKIFTDYLNKHLSFKLNTFKLKTLSEEYTGKCLEKLCSLADIVGGALVDYVGDYHNESKIPVTEEVVGPITHSKEKSNIIIKWFLEDKENLKKNTFALRRTDQGFLFNAYRFPEIKQ